MDRSPDRSGPGPAAPRRRIMSLVSLALIATMTLVIPAEPVFAAKSRVKARVGQNKWQPVHTYIGRGDVVIWKNPRPKNVSKRRVHDVTSIQPRKWKRRLGFRLSKTLQPGERIRRKFRKKGTYRYRCVRHSGMVDGRCQGMCGFIHVL